MIIDSQYLVSFLALFFCISVFFSFLINWLFLKFSFNLGGREQPQPNQVRWAAGVKPAIGGISFFIVFLISISVIGTLPRETSYLLDKRLIGIIASSSLGFVLGLADDAYNTNPLAKFIAQLSCAFILIISDVQIHATGNSAFDFIITIVWVIGLMNSVNMLDNMDAITTTASMCIIAGLIVVIAVTVPVSNTFYLVMLVGVLGALAGFLYFNWHPSKIIMGDTGSQFLGVFLASTSILFFWGFKDENSNEFIQLKQFVVPMLFFIVPLIDTTTVTIRRLLRKQSPFIGGKDHITHHLVYFGLKERGVAVVLIILSLLSFPIALSLILGWVAWTWISTFAAFAYFAVVFGIMQLVYNIGKRKRDEKLAAQSL
ncbi:MAG: undecaprenyl/decaprenyl-phosphate alpha-N-acetylglucosaminyl 1-phosphate transferase [Chitinophagales bacterium]|nr:undecaprenyl/decaprenyl-phosphate alpha-N-acetylglucosaminyl 1-phosphate transferase [Chitinophagales bacterium]